MKPPAAAALLQVWEAGISQPLLERSLHLLRVADAAPDLTAVADFSVGERDARLLQLREWLFGTRLLNKAACPHCSEIVEWATNASDLRLQTLAARPNEFSLEEGSFTVIFRLPNSHDIHRTLSDEAYQMEPKKLLADCITSVTKAGEQVQFENLPAALAQAVVRRMEQEDPQADIQMLLNCPTCANEWKASFDIGSYLWAEIDHWAKRTLEEIMVLARTFGWTEDEILKLTPQRRQIYLNLIGA